MQKVKRVKIKVKHIVYLAGLIFILIPNIIIACVDMKYLVNVQEYGEVAREGGFNNFYKGLLKTYVNMPKISPFEDKGYFLLGINEYDYKNDGVYYFKDTNVRMSTSKESNIKKAIEYHEKGISGKKADEYYMKNSFALISLYYKEGRIDDAFEVIETIKNLGDERAKSFAYFNEGALYYKLNRYEEAIKSFEKVSKDYILKTETYIGDCYLALGDERKAKEIYTSDDVSVINHSKDAKYNIEDIDFSGLYNTFNKIDLTNEFGGEKSEQEVRAQTNENIIKVYKNNIMPDKYKGSIKGNFIFNDIKMTGTQIVLSKDEVNFNGHYGMFLSDGEVPEYSVYVEGNGEFEFNNIIEGVYNIRIKIPKNLYLKAGIDNPAMINNLVNVEKGKTINIKLEQDNKIRTARIANGEESIVEEYNSTIKLLSENINYDELVYLQTNKQARVEEGKLIIDMTKENDVESFSDATIGENLIISKEDKELQFYKMLGPINDGNFINRTYTEYSVENWTDEKEAELEMNNDVYQFKEFDIDSNELKIHYPKEVVEEMNKSVRYKGSSVSVVREFDKVLKYYEEAYAKDSENVDNIIMLIKLYVTGTDISNNNKNVVRALELADELKEIDGNKFLDLHVREFIYTNYMRTGWWSVL